LREDAVDRGDDLSPRIGERREAPALPNEDRGAQLLLQPADLLGDPRLGGVQRVGSLGDVEVAARDLAHVAQLLEIHWLSALYGMVIRIAQTSIFQSLSR